MTEQATTSFPCHDCGARVEHVPGAGVLRCPYCNSMRPIVPLQRTVREHRFGDLTAGEPAPATHVFTCQKCGAHTESDALSERCPFCAVPLVADAATIGQIAPEAVLPFTVDQAGVRTALRKWVSSRWFAPSSLKKVTEAEWLKGVYLPHWTFDAFTSSDYTGQRGDDYWDTETYTETVNGQTETKTRQVRRTRWRSAHGTVQRQFDDVLVAATGRVAPDRLAKLSPWPLHEAQPYQPAYLAGHQSLRYDIAPQDGLELGKQVMAQAIEQDCKDDIGGDHQRVASVDTSYSDVTFKLLLLPLWIVAYLHAGKTWQVLVNARTGEVIGERPYSITKIAAAVLGCLAAVALLIYLFASR